MEKWFPAPQGGRQGLGWGPAASQDENQALDRPSEPWLTLGASEVDSAVLCALLGIPEAGKSRTNEMRQQPCLHSRCSVSLGCTEQISTRPGGPTLRTEVSSRLYALPVFQKGKLRPREGTSSSSGQPASKPEDPNANTFSRVLCWWEGKVLRVASPLTDLKPEEVGWLLWLW